MATSGALDVFINAPFDVEYQQTLRATIFAVIRSGFRVRCALEVDNAAENRLNKICKIISECKFAIHDISRTEINGNPPLPRFNMPLELGLFLGAIHFGGDEHSKKACIIMDREQFRYQKFISDLSGVDIHSHGGKPKNAVLEVTAWLRSISSDAPGGGSYIWNEYRVFQKVMKITCERSNIKMNELTFSDFHNLVVSYVAAI